MRKDEKEILQAQLELEKLAIERLKENYKVALQDIDEKLAALLGRSDSNLQSVIYQVEHQQRLRTQTKAALDQLQANEFETISEYLAECYEDGFESALYSMQQQGVPLLFPIDQAQVAEAIQMDSKISEGLYKRLGKDIGELKKTISSEIARGISTGMSYAQIAKNLNRTADIGLNRAMRITRTEGGRIQNKAAMDAMYKAADNGAEVMKRWSAALDSRTRPSHLMVHGEIRELDKPFSNKLMYPKDPSGGASEVCNCRCRITQKARWALEASETQMLGDVSAMSEERKKEIAKKLGIPVDELQNYSRQIVPVNAKNYADFRKRYNEIWHYEGSDLQRQAEARIASYKRSKNVVQAGRVEANGRFVNSNEKLYRYAERIKPIDGYDDFTCHADADRFYIDMKGGGNTKDFVELSVKEFAEAIKASKSFKGGDIRIISCQAGAKSNGAAQKLANELQVAVYAPTEIVNIDENGEMFITDNDILAEMWYYASKEERAKLKETGTWVRFEPRKE